MLRLCLLAMLCASAMAQYNRDPKTAAIISEERYQSGNGQFGAAYTQEDGIDFKEETDEQGNRRGSYSYVDPSGQRRTISYTAGKNGFQASGDHLPVAPPAPAAPAPQPQYKPQPQYQAQPQPSYQPRNNVGNDYDDGSYDERWNDPSFSGNGRAPAPIPAAPRAPAPQPQWNQPQQPQYNAPAPQPQWNQPKYSAPAPQQQWNQQQYQPAPVYTTTTPNPHRFNPPGKLSLNRTPDGYSYSFNKN